MAAKEFPESNYSPPKQTEDAWPFLTKSQKSQTVTSTILHCSKKSQAHTDSQGGPYTPSLTGSE